MQKQFRPFKMKRVSFVEGLGAYRAENTLQLGYTHRSVKTKVDQRSGKWQSKNTTIFVGTIIYQLHVSALIGHLQVGIQRQRKMSIDCHFPDL